MGKEGQVALVFPGQGSQRAGMARDFHDRFAAARDVFAEASAAAGVDLASICFGEDERLNLTEYTQPCILTAEIAMLRVLEQELDLRGDCFAGHSLGEYTALVAAGVLDVGEAARLVRRRGALMQQAVPAGDGAMLAVIQGSGQGLELDELRGKLTGLDVDAANHNSPSQIVISGSVPGVEAARSRLEAKGRRLIPLKVSAPFHSRFMRGVEPEFAAELAAVALDAGSAFRVAANFTGSFHAADPSRIRENLVRQISGTVRWVDNMRAVEARASRIVEIGPGRPLSGFFREIGVAAQAITDWQSAQKVLGESRGEGEG
jgi:[acyl-carrier-protein] S-malonyltransferase/trans-AT polyketide synthase/acyltransferase/oxidoreductase domain-containing protein